MSKLNKETIETLNNEVGIFVKNWVENVFAIYPPSNRDAKYINTQKKFLVDQSTNSIVTSVTKLGTEGEINRVLQLLAVHLGICSKLLSGEGKIKTYKAARELEGSIIGIIIDSDVKV